MANENLENLTTILSSLSTAVLALNRNQEKLANQIEDVSSKTTAIAEKANRSWCAKMDEFMSKDFTFIRGGLLELSTIEDLSELYEAFSYDDIQVSRVDRSQLMKGIPKVFVVPVEDESFYAAIKSKEQKENLSAYKSSHECLEMFIDVMNAMLFYISSSDDEFPPARLAAIVKLTWEKLKHHTHNFVRKANLLSTVPLDDKPTLTSEKDHRDLHEKYERDLHALALSKVGGYQRGGRGQFNNRGRGSFRGRGRGFGRRGRGQPHQLTASSEQ
jgi:hypothetical protein